VRIAYMPDTHFGGYDQTLPDRRDVANAAAHLIAEAETAERVGFDAIWLPERHARPETFFPSPVVLASAIASRTTRVQIATTVIQPTYYHPVHLEGQAYLRRRCGLSRGLFPAVRSADEEGRGSF